MGEKAPDIKNGYITNGVNQGNSWATEIQCVLVEQRNGKEKRRFLSHECRRENVPFSSGRLGEADSIFQLDNCFEFVTYTEDDKFHQMIVYDSIIPNWVKDNYGGVEIGDSFVLKEETNEKWDSIVNCPDKDIQVLIFDEILNGLIERKIPIRDLFLKIKWEENNARYELFCPCRYINFANPDHEKVKYLQPISGHVLIPLDNNICARGYVACAKDSGGEKIIEFVTVKYENLIQMLMKKNILQELKPILEKLRSILGISAPTFSHAKKVTGDFELFIYK